jgi:hypothetical protein
LPADVVSPTLEPCRQSLLCPLPLGAQIRQSAACGILSVHTIAPFNLDVFSFDRESQSEGASELFRW